MEWPLNNKEILEAIEKLFSSGKWWIYKGKEAFEFEKKFAAFHDSEFGISACNGTVTLEIVLRALGIGKGANKLSP